MGYLERLTPRYSELELARDYSELTHYAGVLGGDRLDASETAIDGWAAFLEAEAERDSLRVQHISLFWHDWFDRFVLLVLPDGSPYDLPAPRGLGSANSSRRARLGREA